MPFKSEFSDIYKYGIKGAAEDVGAYSERVDEQDYTESMLDRIYNQINKADVVVADMTGQNPNVFYEVGYAHALNKIVLLLTQDSNDIPFDLKHRPHIVYGGQIEILRNKLAQKLTWAINESRTRTKTKSLQTYGVMVEEIYLPEASTFERAPTVELSLLQRKSSSIKLKILVQNLSSETTIGVSHIYLFTSDDSPITPLYTKRLIVRDTTRSILRPLQPVKSLPVGENNVLPVRYRLDMQLPQIPPNAVEEQALSLQYFAKGEIELDETSNELRTHAPQKEVPLILRLHTHNSVQDFPFKLKVTVLLETPEHKSETV
jgi:hypothetical protein